MNIFSNKYSLIPLLIRPSIASFCNRWQKHQSTPEKGRDAVILIFSGIIATVIYEITRYALTSLHDNPAMSYLPPSQPLSIILMLLVVMLITSNTALAFHYIYISRDIERIIASPLSTTFIFRNKFIHILLLSAWMPFVFLLPFLLAFGLHSDSSPFFYLMIPIVLMPLFIISTSLGLIVATSISLFLPASRHKIARLLFCAIIVFFLYGLIKLFFAFISGAAYAPPLTHILRFFSIPSTLWLPSRWASTILGQLLNNTHQLIPLDELILLYSTSIWMSGICYMLFEIFFLRAYSNTQIEPGERKYRESYVSNLFSAIFFPLPPLVQQIALKEIKLIIRDIGYLFEVIMLFSLSMVYLANLRSYVALDHLSIIERSDWTLPVFMLNIAMNAFIITSLCVRFVFPTLSREGEAFWVLTTSPLERQKILTLKFQFWVVPIIIIGELFLTLSAYLLRIPLGLWIIYASAYCAICIAIVGGAVGLGTVHALQGECDSPQQVTGGIGSFLFMVLAIIVIIINIIPLKLMTEYIGYGIIDSQEMFFLMATLLLLIYFDCQVARWSLKQGRDKLIKQMM